MIKNKKNGKATGFSNVSNEMLKYGLCKNITETMSYMMEWIINSGNVPKLFNISLLKPLIKDKLIITKNNLTKLTGTQIMTVKMLISLLLQIPMAIKTISMLNSIMKI
jgi:hypothetical protein